MNECVIESSRMIVSMLPTFLWHEQTADFGFFGIAWLAFVISLGVGLRYISLDRFSTSDMLVYFKGYPHASLAATISCAWFDTWVSLLVIAISMRPIKIALPFS